MGVKEGLPAEVAADVQRTTWRLPDSPRVRLRGQPVRPPVATTSSSIG